MFITAGLSFEDILLSYPFQNLHTGSAATGEKNALDLAPKGRRGKFAALFQICKQTLIKFQLSI